MNNITYLMLHTLEKGGGKLNHAQLYLVFRQVSPEISLFLKTIKTLHDLKLLEKGEIITITEYGVQHLRQLEKETK